MDFSDFIQENHLSFVSLQPMSADVRKQYDDFLMPEVSGFWLKIKNKYKEITLPVLSREKSEDVSFWLNKLCNYLPDGIYGSVNGFLEDEPDGSVAYYFYCRLVYTTLRDFLSEYNMKELLNS
jgi:hypothetical protein